MSTRGHLPKLISEYLLGRHDHFKVKEEQASAKELERWAGAINSLLQTNTIKCLVPRGDPERCSAMFSTSPVVKTLVEFRGQGCICKIYKAGRRPRSGEDRVLKRLK